MGGRGEDAELGDPPRLDGATGQAREAVLGRGHQPCGQQGYRFECGPSVGVPPGFGVLVGLVVVRPAARIGVGLGVGLPRAMELLQLGEGGGQEVIGAGVGAAVLVGDRGYRACRTGADGAGTGGAAVVRTFFA
ncbi:hypothetical protein GCM10010232_50240 [Streptomyces amakusaensis]